MSTRASSAAAGALVLVLALSGCRSGDEPRAAASPSAAAGAGFDSPEELRAALGAAGVPCEEPINGSFPGATEALSCVVNDAEDVVLLRFGSSAERDDYVANREELSSAVVGEDWAVQTVLRPTAEQVQDALGGELLLAPES